MGWVLVTEFGSLSPSRFGGAQVYSQADMGNNGWTPVGSAAANNWNNILLTTGADHAIQVFCVLCVSTVSES